ncbi:hypothetical protein WUBG_01877 [Wuchereria bancrofti]|uniref:Uncharacterized protein n=1 Tax=Wuchereria bancrofti TaxID=6293 RepID=J9EYA2_WUCBA|nr:hypothetical protein WUBG_01877 [Wuchereria bancrofti]
MAVTAATTTATTAAAATAATTSRPSHHQSSVHRGEIVNCIRRPLAFEVPAWLVAQRVKGDGSAGCINLHVVIMRILTEKLQIQRIKPT